MPGMRQREAHEAFVGSGRPVEERNCRRTARHATRPLQLQLRVLSVELSPILPLPLGEGWGEGALLRVPLATR